MDNHKTQRFIRSRRFAAGDVLGFSGRHFDSWCIRIRDLSRWSHVAILAPYEGELVIWESVSKPTVPCVVCGELHAGVHAVPIDHGIQSYGGRIWVSRIKDPLDQCSAERLGIWLTKQHGKPYDHLQVLISVLPVMWLWGSGYDDRGWFCAELVFSCLRRADRVDRSTSPASWRPATIMRRLPRAGILEWPEQIWPDVGDEAGVNASIAT